jgi:hypothetical protein
VGACIGGGPGEHPAGEASCGRGTAVGSVSVCARLQRAMRAGIQAQLCGGSGLEEVQRFARSVAPLGKLRRQECRRGSEASSHHIGALAFFSFFLFSH